MKTFANNLQKVQECCFFTCFSGVHLASKINNVQHWIDGIKIVLQKEKRRQIYMKVVPVISILLMILVFSAFMTNPSFNGITPGCAGGGCHSLQSGLISVTPLNNLQLQVAVSGVSAGKEVAGELVNANNQVVHFVNSTNDNPFILTAPQTGQYTVNAGFKSPALRWSSATINLSPTTLNIPTPTATGSTIELFPNHPNPFNLETVIRFSLPRPARVELEVYTVHGQLIKRLTGGHLPTGIHSLKWNGRDDEGRPCPSGIYLFQIKSDDHRVVRSMILSK